MWEFKLLTCSVSDLVIQLNRESKSGWDVLSVIPPQQDSVEFRVIFRRINQANIHSIGAVAGQEVPV